MQVARLATVLCLFFFQAEDGIRDPLVTGVQTCALPIYSLRRQAARPDYFFDNILSLGNDAPFFEQAADINPLTGGTPNSHFYFRNTSYNFFVQNDWKFRKNLTLNLGLRYEYTTPISEKNGHLSNYIPGPNG